MGLELFGDVRFQATFDQRGRGDLDEQVGGLAGLGAFGDHADGVADDPAVDVVEQAVFFGDRQVGDRRDDFAGRALHAQVDVVVFFLGAGQADDRLVVQHELVAGQGLADALHPGLDALFLGAVARGRVEDFGAVAAHAFAGRQALAGLGHHLRDRGDALADLHAADADAEVHRTFAQLQDVVLEGLADAVGLGLALGVVVVLAQHGEPVVAHARHQGVFVQRALEPVGHAPDQVVGGGQANFGQQVFVVVGFDQQQRLLALALGGAHHRRLEFGHEVLAVEQAGELVALAQRIELGDHVGVHGLLAEDDLQAAFAFVGGRGEFHHRIEVAAVGALGPQFELARRCLALAHLLQDLAEVVGVLGRDQVEHGQAFDFLEVLEAEHFQVGVVGADVHAFVHVGDRVARGGDERVAAAFGFTQRGFKMAQAAAGLERGELGAHHRLHVFRAAADGDVAGTRGQGRQRRLFVQGGHRGDDRDVLARGGDALEHGGQRQVTGFEGGNDDVDALLAEYFDKLVLGFRALRAHRHAAIAQVADDLFGVVQAVFHQEQTDHGILLCHPGHSFTYQWLARGD